MKISKAIEAAVLKQLEEIGYIKHAISSLHEVKMIVYNNNPYATQPSESYTQTLYSMLSQKYETLMMLLNIQGSEYAHKIAKERFSKSSLSAYPHLFHGRISNNAGEHCFLSTTEDEFKRELEEILVSKVRTEETANILENG